MRGDDGYILVAVLGTMLVLAGLLAASSLVSQSVLRSARADEGAAELDGLARGGLEIAAYQVFALHIPFAEVNGRSLRFAGGSATATFTDEAGRIDVNATDPTVLLATLRSAGLDEGAAGAVVTRLVVLRQGGARGDGALVAPDAVAPRGAAAAGVKPAAKPPRGNFRSVADFIAFAGVGRAVAATLQPLLTTSNPDGRIDVLTASRRVLMALPDMSAARVDNLLAERRAGASAIERIKGALGPQAASVKFEPGPCYGVTVLARDTMGRSATRHGIVAASRSPSVPFSTLMWE